MHLVYESLLAIESMNAVATFLRSQHWITKHDHAQIYTEVTAVLQLKTLILGKLEAIYFLCRSSQLSLSPVPQSSPPNRDGRDYTMYSVHTV